MVHDDKLFALLRKDVAEFIAFNRASNRTCEFSIITIKPANDEAEFWLACDYINQRYGRRGLSDDAPNSSS